MPTQRPAADQVSRMAHLSLYRKYRPATFDEVVGQEHVTRTLRNAIESGKTSHAYLFAGSRGTGKTSVAKLLAKALNCVDGPTADPCGKCDSCVAIGAGSSLDVVEMDAASNRGIDDIRDIRDKVAFSPVEGKSKVYILDEAHMLTKEASNAFLKVLEEPPGHVIFVLCTTEAHKVLPTIQSRCQRFEFRRPDSNMVLEVLKRITAAENIDIEESGLSTIARSSSGSFRDAIGALDQLATYSDGKITLTDVLAMLGTVESELLFEAVDIIAEEDARGALLLVNRLADAGRDFSQFAGELIGHLRNIFLLQQLEDPPAGMINAPDEDLARLRGQARMVTPGQVGRFVELLSRALAEIKTGADPRLQLELAFVAMARPETDLSTRSMLYRIEQLEQRRPGASSTGAAGSAAKADSAADRTAAEATAEAPAERVEDTPQAAASSVPPVTEETPGRERAKPPQADAADSTAASEVTLDKIERAWSVILNQVKKDKLPVHSMLQEARPLELDGNELVVGFPPGMEFHKTQAEKPDYVAVLGSALREIAGTELRPRFVISEGASPLPEEKPPPTHEDIIAMIKEDFDAEEIS